MRKNRTSKPIRHRLRQGAALCVLMIAAWLVWLTGDPAAAMGRLRALASSTQVTTALLSSELGIQPLRDGLSGWDRLVLAQSSLLSATLPSTLPTPPNAPSNTEHQNQEPEFPDVGENDELPTTTTAPDNIISRTMVAGSSAKYVSSGNVSIYNHTDYSLDVNALLAAATDLPARGKGPQILIYHSHATEAYTMDGTDVYQESDSYRTLNTDYNMVRIGAEMKAVFEAAGLEVIHDTTLYDYPSYNNAYIRSVEGVAKWLDQYPSLTLILDIHRDALAASDGTIYKTSAGTIENCAQVMMVLGSDASGQTHPNWKANLSLAAGIQAAITNRWTTLARPIVLRTSRFNQHLSTGMLLVEVGSHGNTLQEAITAARLFARAVSGIMTT